MQNFFNNNGITATSANHIANMAKEYYEDLTTQLKSIRFYNSEIELLTAGKKVQTSTGLSKSDWKFTQIEAELNQIASCKALIAYLREAIKAKEELTMKVEQTIPDGIEMPKAPIMPSKKTQKDVLDTWPLEKVVRYYRVQAYAATYGEIVHPSGSLAKARKDFLDKLSNPTSVDLKGSETIISTFTPTIDTQSVEDLFFKIQKEYRALQAEFNGLESEIKKTIQDEFDSTMDKYTADYQSFQSEQKRQMDNLFKWRSDEKQKIEKLKIQIPENLKSIYDTINNLSKN